eukprot:510252_1
MHTKKINGVNKRKKISVRGRTREAVLKIMDTVVKITTMKVIRKIMTTSTSTPLIVAKKGSIRQWKENVKKDYGKWKEDSKYKESGDGEWKEDYEYSDSEDSGSGYDYNYGYDGKKGGYRRRQI